jgi:hypothetical protein
VMRRDWLGLTVQLFVGWTVAAFLTRRWCA